MSLRLVSFLTVLIILFITEQFRPFFNRRKEAYRAWATNLGFGLLNSGISSTLCLYCSNVFVVWLPPSVALIKVQGMGYILHTALLFVVLDFFYYAWHRANHVIPFLWRFHQVHHSDSSLDVTTASRFHFGEILISIVLRFPVLFLFSPSLAQLIYFDLFFNVFTQVEHANISLGKFEKTLARVFVTPGLHKLHHSKVSAEYNSNYGTILSLWDAGLRTLNRRNDLSKLEIGLTQFPKSLTFLELVLVPIGKAFKRVSQLEK